VNPVLVLSERDNVATALEPLEAGRTVAIGEVRLTVLEPIPAGHKLAVVAIEPGADVVKHGHAIGTTSRHVVAGTHVHTHNVASSRGRGDLAPAYRLQSRPAGRLAEPPDEVVRGTGPGAVHDIEERHQ
jgi:altronate dehydratase small subunit